MAPFVPSEEEVLGYMDSCSNWGRWGDDDELGTVNLITPEARLAAAALVKDGVTVSCSRLIPRTAEVDFDMPPLHFMTGGGERFEGKKTQPDELQSTGDFFGVAYHGFTITHVDSLSHVLRDGVLYNGRPANLISTAQGSQTLAVEALKDGVVSRGVLLDIPKLRGVDWLERTDGVYREDLEAAERELGVTVRPGDVLLARFGAVRRRNEEGPSRKVYEQRPGFHAVCVPWFHERGVAAVGSDSAQDLFPSGYPHMRAPVHQIGIVAMGLWLIDNCDLEALAETCDRLGRYEFLFSMGPLRITGGTGSPVNPIAVF